MLIPVLWACPFKIIEKNFTPEEGFSIFRSIYLKTLFTGIHYYFLFPWHAYPFIFPPKTLPRYFLTKD